MELGIIGDSKMGSNMAERLRLAGHKVTGFDFNASPVAKLTAAGSVGVSTLEDLVSNSSTVSRRTSRPPIMRGAFGGHDVKKI